MVEVLLEALQGGQELCVRVVAVPYCIWVGASPLSQGYSHPSQGILRKPGGALMQE